MGEPTRPNSCLDDTQIPGNQALCVDGGEDEGECLIGPIDDYCSLETSRSCLDDAE